MARKATRTPEVLSLIARYGVLSTRVLLMLLDGEVASRWLRQILCKLEDRGLIVRATSNIGGTPVDYWMLSKESISLNRVSALTNSSVSDFRIKKARYTHFPHEDLCTMFQVSIERQIATLLLLRESSNDYSALPETVLSRRLKDLGYAPDLVIGLPKQIGDTSTSLSRKWIAVEIDRSYRSTKRMSQRVNVYTRHTGFDGLLYLMPKREMANSLNDVYRLRGAKDALRIKGSKDTFLATGIVSKKLFDVNEYDVSLGNKSISLTTWLGLITITNKEERDMRLQSLSSLMEENHSKVRIAVSA